ncbi:MAG: phage tail protein [Fusobacterium ulcerans]|uniref:phage tail protein n=1 Tax=Fusobacterium ulcerans TaxID=861 RepID=UPI003A855D86
MIRKVATDIARDYLNNFQLYNYISSIGSFGKIVFRVAENNVLTPSEVGMTIAARVKQHQRLKGEDVTEYLTRELRKITLPIKLIRDLCNINETLNELIRVCEVGEHYPLILGKKKIGSHNFRIENFQAKYAKTDGLGNPLVMEITLNLQEYIEDIERTATEELVTSEGTTELKDKVIKNVNTKIMTTLKGGRLW